MQEYFWAFIFSPFTPEPFAKVFSLRSLRLCGVSIHRRDAEDAEKGCEFYKRLPRLLNVLTF